MCAKSLNISSIIYKNSRDKIKQNSETKKHKTHKKQNSHASKTSEILTRYTARDVEAGLISDIKTRMSTAIVLKICAGGFQVEDKKKYQTTIAVRLTDAVYEKIKVAAANDNRNMSNFLTSCCLRYIDEQVAKNG